MAPLAAIPGVQLISLQKGHGLDTLRLEPPRFPLTLLGDALDAEAAFVDTAAVMTHLDLVVTADTSIAHLAGALGVPVWLALSAIADWRWVRQRHDTPWYPTMRLFRQRTHGDWADVFARMAGEVARLCERRATTSILAPLTPGELLDKLTILTIKRQRLTDPEKCAHVEAERTALMSVRARLVETAAVAELTTALQSVNEALWEVEDALRDCERQRDFGDRFVRLARSVYHYNDRRAALKRQLNDLVGAPFREEKAYAAYESDAAIQLTLTTAAERHTDNVDASR